jgi:type IV secretion system protein VirB10
VLAGSRRVLIAFDRAILPDGSTLDLPQQTAVDSLGASGLRDKVSTHFWRSFRAATVLSVISAVTELATDDSTRTQDREDFGDALSQSLAQEYLLLSQRILDKELNLAPTLEIREGFPFNVMLDRDLLFQEPYS